MQGKAARVLRKMYSSPRKPHATLLMTLILYHLQAASKCGSSATILPISTNGIENAEPKVNNTSSTWLKSKQDVSEEASGRVCDTLMVTFLSSGPGEPEGENQEEKHQSEFLHDRFPCPPLLAI